MIDESVKTQLTTIKEAWDSLANVPEDLASWNHPTLSKAYIGEQLGALIEYADTLNQIEDFEVDALSLVELNRRITSLNTAISHVEMHNSSHLPNFLVHLEQVKTLLLTLVGYIESGHNKAQENLTKKMAETSAKLNDAINTYESFISKFESAVESANAAEESSSTAIRSSEEALQSLDDIKELLASTKTFRDETEDFRGESEEHLDKAKSASKDVENLSEHLENTSAHLNRLILSFKSQEERVDELLGDANRTGMASSFKNRKDELRFTLIGWSTVFVASLFGLTYFGSKYVMRDLALHGWDMAFYALPITMPMIWLAWFSSKQYGATSKLREDYAYKEASAMSFEGYKREAGELSEEMLTKLLQTSIQNFSDNPIRIYDGKGDHSSPAHELVEKVINNPKTLNALKDLIGKIKE